MKKVLCSFLAMIMLLSMGTTAFAAPSTNSNADKNIFEILASASEGVTTQTINGEVNYTITNPEIIAQLSNSEDLPDVIELTYIPAETSTVIMDSTDVAQPMLFDSYEIRNKTDHGDGWYNSTIHQEYEFYIDGPDTFVIDERRTFTASVNCNIEAAVEVISAGVGFEIGTEHELHFQSNTPVEAGKRLHVEIFRTHRKVTFDLYKKPWLGSWERVGSNYEALKPNGTFIKKEFWNV